MTTDPQDDAVADLPPQDGSLGPDVGEPTGDPVADGSDHGSGPAAGTRALVTDLSCLPAMRGYLDRIGARPRGMFSAAVIELDGRYPRTVATVRLSVKDKVWALTVTAEAGDDAGAFEPTETERHAILIEAADARWPEHNKVNSARNLPDGLRQAQKADSLFEFRDADGLIVMLQERVPAKDDSKSAWVPWTYWTDNEWRRLEPEGLLPLWGIDQLKPGRTVFLHEGARPVFTAVESVWDSQG